MSALSLKFPYRRHGLSDDLESFLHVIAYLTMRFHESIYSRNPTRVKQVINFIYEEQYQEQNGLYTGGGTKYDEIIGGCYPASIVPLFSLGLGRLITELLELCSDHYKCISEEITKWHHALDRGEFTLKDTEIGRSDLAINS